LSENFWLTFCEHGVDVLDISAVAACWRYYSSNSVDLPSL